MPDTLWFPRTCIACVPACVLIQAHLVNTARCRHHFHGQRLHSYTPHPTPPRPPKQVVRDGPREADHRHFLDRTQYTSRSISRYERVFGDGFISTGGLETTKVHG